MNQKKLKILFITHLYYPSIGGAENMYKQIAEGLVGSGHDVSVLTTDVKSINDYFNDQAKRTEKKEETLNGVQVYRYSWPKGNIFIRLINIFGRLSSRTLKLIAPLFYGPYFLTAKSYHLVKSEPWDWIVAGPTPTNAMLYGYLAKKLTGAKLAVIPCLHTVDKVHSAPLHMKVFNSADHIFTLTKAEDKFLINNGVPANKISTIGAGVSPKLLSQEKSKRTDISDYVLFIGQEGIHKNIVDLIDAMCWLWRFKVENKLVIAGVRTRYSVKLDKYIKKLDPEYQERIIRKQNFNKDEKIELIDNAALLVNPSSQESFGIVFIEAWARGKPVIGTDIPAVKNLISHNKDGFIYKDRKVYDLTGRIFDLLEEKGRRKRMGMAGKEKVLGHNQWQVILNKFEDALK